MVTYVRLAGEITGVSGDWRMKEMYVTSTLRKGALAVGVVAAVALTTSVAQTAQAASDSPKLAPMTAVDSAKAIDGSYIVVLKDGTTSSQTAQAADRAEAAGAKVDKEYLALKGYAAELDADQLKKVRQDPAVAYVEQDQKVTVNTTQSGATWGLDRIDQRNLPLNGTYTYTPTGQGVKAYIIDTGLLSTHNEFSGRTASGYTAISDGRGTTDCHGHGTHVAGTVGGTTYGVAKKVTIVPVRVLDCSGSGSNSGVIAGMDWVTNNHSGASVANMSLGGGASTATDSAVARMTSSGVTVAVAAGNENTNACNSSPARAPSAITVGSTTNTDARSSFSNYGTCVDLFAPGSSITSAWYTSNTATNTISGTSMATPHVTGVAALYLQGNPGASPATVSSAITGTATPGKVTNPGSGSPNLLLYSLLNGGGTPPPPSGDCDETTTGTATWGYETVATSFTTTTSGSLTGCLTGPSGTDFDLYLDKWNGSSWVEVAAGEGSTSTENVTYSSTAGQYRWVVYAYSGSGSYTLKFGRP